MSSECADTLLSRGLASFHARLWRRSPRVMLGGLVRSHAGRRVRSGLQAISTKAIACLLVAATVVLLLMYFLYKYVVYLFIFLFGLGSAVATARCLSLLLAKVIPSEKQPSTTVRYAPSRGGWRRSCVLRALLCLCPDSD